MKLTRKVLEFSKEVNVEIYDTLHLLGEEYAKHKDIHYGYMDLDVDAKKVRFM